jgi:hypothetical protein
VLNSKLSKIKELIEAKERIDAELAQLLGEQEKPKRGRPRTDKTEPSEVVESQ